MNLIQRIFKGKTDKTFGGSLDLYNTNNSQRFAPQLTLSEGKEYYTGIISSCVDLRSKNCAKAKPIMYRWINQTDNYELNKHPFINLLRQPNEFMSYYNLMEQTVQNLDLMGNCYLYLPLGNLNIPTAIYVLPTTEMQVKADKKTGKPIGYTRKYMSPNGMINIDYNLDEIIHLKYTNPNNQYYGMSVIQKAALEAGIHLAQGQYQLNYYLNDAVPKQILTSEQNISKEDLERLKATFGSEYGGLSNAGKTPILFGGIKLQSLQTNPKELDYIQSKKYSREEVMNIFGIPQGLLVSENVNRANIYGGIVVFDNMVIQPILKLIASQISLYISRIYNNNLFLEFVSAKTIDEEFEFKQIESAFKSGAITINEFRRYLKYDPIPEGDELINQKSNTQEQDTNNTEDDNTNDDNTEDDNDNTESNT